MCGVPRGGCGGRGGRTRRRMALPVLACVCAGVPVVAASVAALRVSSRVSSARASGGTATSASDDGAIRMWDLHSFMALVRRCHPR